MGAGIHGRRKGKGEGEKETELMNFYAERHFFAAVHFSLRRLS